MTQSSPHHGHGREVGRFGLAADALPALDEGPADPHAWFLHDDPHAREHPLELEIGSGKGTFLAQQAPRHPQVNYVGVEYARAYWRHAADRARRRQLTNVRLVHREAAAFVRFHCPDRACRQVHIYFPDPWPKKRHHKRRLIQEPFLEALCRILENPSPGDPRTGRLRLATDHEDYFAWMEEHARRVDHLYERLPFESPESARQGEWAGTNFERKYRPQGRRFQGMILRKRETPA